MQARVDTAGQAGLASHSASIDYVELESLVDDLPLDSTRELIPDLVWSVVAIQEERGTRLRCCQHIHLLEKVELVTSHEVGFLDLVRRADRLFAEPEVGDRRCTRFLRVVDEVTLCIERSVLPDDLDRVLVGADRSVGPEAEEHGPGATLGLG